MMSGDQYCIIRIQREFIIREQDVVSFPFHHQHDRRQGSFPIRIVA